MISANELVGMAVDYGWEVVPCGSCELVYPLRGRVRVDWPMACLDGPDVEIWANGRRGRARWINRANTTEISSALAQVAADNAEERGE